MERVETVITVLLCLAMLFAGGCVAFIGPRGMAIVGRWPRKVRIPIAIGMVLLAAFIALSTFVFKW